MGVRGMVAGWAFGLTRRFAPKRLYMRHNERRALCAWTKQQARTASYGGAGDTIFVPTPRGFSNEPGCVESYAATAVVEAALRETHAERRRRCDAEVGGGTGGGGGCGSVLVHRVVERHVLPLSALEFGGDFQALLQGADVLS